MILNTVVLFFGLLLGEPEEGTREKYYQAIQEEKTAIALLEQLNTVHPASALDIAYTGATQALMAKHVFNPISKIKWLKKADRSMKKAVKLDQNNFEIRFLRFSYQHFVPSFLGYSEELEEDLQCMVRLVQEDRVNNVPESMKKNAIRFLIESGRCNFQQRNILSKSL